MATYTSNYGWIKPSGSDNVDISVLNDNLDDQDSTIHDAFLNMAPPFSEASTYAVDDIVLYGTGLYKCHTAVVTPGPWTGSTNWQVYKLSEGGSGGGGYVLPVATASRLGGVKIGSGISVEEDGTISASGGGSGEIKNLDNGMLSHSTDSSYITVNLDVPLTAGKEYKITIRDAQYNYVDTKQIIWTSDVDVVFPGVGSSGSYGIRLTQTTVSLYNYGGTGWRDIYCDIVSDFSSENYNDFTNKPSINGVELSGNKTTNDLGIRFADLPDAPTLGTASSKNVPASGDASSSQVVMGNDSRLTDSRPASDVSSWAKQSTKPTYTASEVGAIPSTDKGVNGGVAELDSNGKVPSSQLPSYVDDVLSYASQSAFPATGETGKIYIAEDTNKTYRWSGSVYAEISESLALGETSSTAYRGDRGKTAYDHSQTTGNPHGTTKSDVGLSNVPNVSTNDQTPTFSQASARNNIASGEKLSVILGKIQKFFNDLKTVAFSGSYADLSSQPQINSNTLTGNKTTSDLGIDATNVMMSDGVTSVEDAINDVTSGTFTGNLGFTFKWAKYGKIVSLYATNDTTKIPQGNTIIGDIPDNILPNTEVSVFDCYQAFKNKCSIMITSTNKKISLYCDIPTGTSSPYYVRGNITYICN